jgi:ketosteroid isomerase-like protein
MRLQKTPLLAFLLLSLLFAACNKKTTPKDISAAFIQDLYTMNFDDASASGTDATKAIIQKNEKDLKDKGMLDEERSKRTEAAAESAFSTKTLKTKISGNEADVSNDAVSVHLKLEDGKWKVSADDAVVEAILYREAYLATAKAAWQQLHDAYDKRTTVVKDYLAYKNENAGVTRETKTLTDAFNKLKAPATDRVAYVREQDFFTALLDKNVLPTFTAGSDLTLNYIVQLSAARDQIAEAKKAYNEAAAKAKSKDFPLVPEK